MNPVCPTCKSEIPIEDVDFSSESAICCHCQQDFDCRTWISTIYGAKTGNQQQIALEGEKVITLARGVRPDRLRFMLIALYQMRRAKAGSRDAH
jgi:hypothetical protein